MIMMGLGLYIGQTMAPDVFFMFVLYTYFAQILFYKEPIPRLWPTYSAASCSYIV